MTSTTHQQTEVPLADALAATVVDRDGDGATVATEVHPGFDVFTIPHGGYLAALAGAAVLAATEQPDLFTITTHYLRKAELGPLTWTVQVAGGSRRFTTVQARATQGDRPVLAVQASVGDRSGIEGPSWRRSAPWSAEPTALAPPAGEPGPAADAPTIARRFGLRADPGSFAFAAGRRTDDATLRAVVGGGNPHDQLTALIACDVTPPAVWNALGAAGWVPTLELTAHVRARPAAGPLTVVASTDHVTDGFLDEDALVHDSEGTLVVQSRQLARWTGA